MASYRFQVLAVTVVHPMFIYDKTAGKWLINGVLRSGHPYQGKENTYQIARKNYLDEIIAGDLLTVFDFIAASYDWTADGNGSGKLTKGSRVVSNTPLANYSLPSSGRDGIFLDMVAQTLICRHFHHGKNYLLWEYGKRHSNLEK